MATIQEILDKINASKSNNVNNNSFIDLMRQISGNPEDAIAPVNDTNSIYGHIVQMYTTLYNSGVDYAILADEVDMLQGVYDNLIAINSIHADKTKLDSIYADKIKLDQLFADKAVIDRVYGSITNIDRVHTSIDKLDTVYASVSKMDTVADNIADVNTVADNIVVLNEIYDNRVEIYAADDNAVIATTKATEAAISAATALGYKNDVSTMKLAIETIYDTFDDRFLGTKTTNPLVDNDGNALIDGAMYFNTSSNAMKVYDVGTMTWYQLPQVYLSALLDVQLTSITSGNVLRWNGTKWINYALSKSDVGLNLIDNTSDSAKNVLSATKLATARTISLSGDVAGSTSFNGSGNVSITATVADDSHIHSTSTITGLGTAATRNVGSGINDVLPANPQFLELGRLGSGDRISFIDFISSGELNTIDFSARIIREEGVDGELSIINTGTGDIRFSSSPRVPTPTTGEQAANKAYADLKVALADFTGANVSFGTIGYQKLPSGLIIQWGTKQLNITAINTLINTHVIFPIVFPKHCLNTITTLANTGTAYTNISSESPLPSQYTIVSSSGITGLLNVNYFAVGY